MWGASNASLPAGDVTHGGAAAQRPVTDYFERNGWPDPGWPYSSKPGLLTGLFAVACGQAAVIAYHYFHLRTRSPRIQKGELVPLSFWRDAAGHLAQPEGFLLLGSYLAGTWMFRIMPQSYYSGEGGVNFAHVFLQVAHVPALRGKLLLFSCVARLVASSDALWPMAVGHQRFFADDHASGGA